MSNIKTSHPELVEKSSSTVKRKATGNYNSDSDKMAMDVGGSELRGVINCLNRLDIKLEKLLLMMGEISGIDGDKL